MFRRILIRLRIPLVYVLCFIMSTVPVYAPSAWAAATQNHDTSFRPPASTPNDITSQIRIRVEPTVAFEPATITVRADVTPHDDNRELIVTIDGENAYMSSIVQLEGSKGPRFSELKFHKLPMGTYEILAVVMGTHKPRATARQSIVVREVTLGPLLLGFSVFILAKLYLQ